MNLAKKKKLKLDRLCVKAKYTQINITISCTPSIQIYENNPGWEYYHTTKPSSPKILILGCGSAGKSTVFKALNFDIGGHGNENVSMYNICIKFI